MGSARCWLRRAKLPVYLLAAGAVAVTIGACLWARRTEGEQWAVPPAFSVTGQVLDPSREPVSNAQVLVGPSRRALAAETLATWTDDRGSFAARCETAEPEVCAAAYKAGFPLTMARTRPGERVTLQFGESRGVCAGEVTDSKGRPIAGTMVSVRALHSGGTADWLSVPGMFRLRDTTDAAGGFKIANLAPGQWVELEAVAQGYERVRHRGEVAELFGATGAGPGLSIALEREAVISGRVTCDGGRAGVVWAWCAALNPDSEGGGRHTSADGTYQFRNLQAGTYLVSAYAEGYYAGSQRVVVRAGQHAAGILIKLRHGAIVTGTVRTAGTHRPVGKAVVVAVGAGRGESAATDRSGAYRLTLAPGGYAVQIDSIGPRFYPRAYQDRRSIEVAAGQALQGVDFFLH